MKIVTFGELLLRLAAPGYTRLFQKDSLDTSFCGGEANVAASLAIFGMESQFVTKLPDNDVGKAAANSLRYFGVDVSEIVYGDGRMGLYYIEKGASQRSSKVIYDRKYSAISMADAEAFDWVKIFEGADWFHFTGINPALSDSLFEICMQACKEAKKQRVQISCDLNYRSALWSSEQAKERMTKLLPFVDVCIANEEDADKALGIKADNTDVESGKIEKVSYVKVAEEICDIYKCKYVAITLRKSYSASRNGWSAMLYNASEKKSYFSREYDINIIDRVGSGDSFAAGIIYGLVNGNEVQETVDFATAASCLKHTIEGDFNRVTVKDVYNLMSSSGNGRVER